MSDILKDLGLDLEDIAAGSSSSTSTTVSPVRKRQNEKKLHRRRRRRPDRQDRTLRLRVAAWSGVGVVCLLIAHWLAPDVGTLFTMPSTASHLAALLCGITGVFLVPGIWLSAIVMRTGADLTAWWATRIGTTLSWYALVGPIIHHLGQGALVTSGGILIVTAAASAAVTTGVLLGLSSRPARAWQRVLLSAVIGAVCAQTVIFVSMRTWTHDMNYSHIQRLDWLIVLTCAALVAIGMLSRPKLPPARTFANSRSMLVFLAMGLSATAALLVANVNWPPAQRMSSSFGIQQVAGTRGNGIAFELSAIGAQGPQMIERAKFSAFDQAGRRVPVQVRLVGADGASTRATLLIVPQEGTQPVLCRPGRPAKITVHDETTGVRTQALLPQGWCSQ